MDKLIPIHIYLLGYPPRPEAIIDVTRLHRKQNEEISTETTVKILVLPKKTQDQMR